ncbi:methyltetrahydrofolate cobalamin methyltransferase [Thermosediminibacter oceani]|uniref:Methionine synthase n=1 Tax=Thermosediminibacter oceani (strain ATCC BAA-1034 / DSM 16646 / JW/IW-1228P) TaxID=555079 RepID=D9S364_THEOJ|nr:methyltetrahydrofolate cobalamin methyltransferase [Thermosediminibacter oceani]ADL07841.1 Methionine synthase [Thermosediminibacter oceani DSM 16646]
MLIVGELINSSRKSIAQALEARDEAYLKDLAKKQAEAGAHIIDINCAIFMEKEPEVMEWLVGIIQEAVDVPLCIDTPNVAAMEVGLSRHKGRAMINSISAEKKRWEEMLPLVSKYKPMVIALCIDDAGMPNSVEDRLRVADKLIPGLVEAGISEEDIYLDPLIKPLGVSGTAAVEVLETTRALREKYPKVHVISGLSNVSHGLPVRKVLNRAFAVMCAEAGMDALIADPLDRHLMSLVFAAEALAGRDKHCLNYIKASRAGKVVAE